MIQHPRDHLFSSRERAYRVAEGMELDLEAQITLEDLVEEIESFSNVKSTLLAIFL